MSTIHGLSDTVKDFKADDRIAVDVETTAGSGVWVTKYLTKQNLFEFAGRVLKISISNAQLLALFTTPITLVAAPGPGYVVACDWSAFKFNWGSIAFASHSALLIKNSTAVDEQGGRDGYLSGSANSFTTLAFVDNKIGANQYVENDALVLTSTGDPTAGDSDGVLYYKYFIFEI